MAAGPSGMPPYGSPLITPTSVSLSTKTSLMKFVLPDAGRGQPPAAAAVAEAEEAAAAVREAARGRRGAAARPSRSTSSSSTSRAASRSSQCSFLTANAVEPLSLFSTMKAVAVAAAVRRNCARVMPCRFACSAHSSAISARPASASGDPARHPLHVGHGMGGKRDDGAIFGGRRMTTSTIGWPSASMPGPGRKPAAPPNGRREPPNGPPARPIGHGNGFPAAAPVW